MTYTIKTSADHITEEVIASAAEVTEVGALVFSLDRKLIAGFAPGMWRSFTYEDDK